MAQLPRNDDGTLQAYAWPGGYQLYYLDKDNSVLCPKCANKSDSDPDELPQFKPVDYGVNDEDRHLYCDQCCELIPASYYADEDPHDDCEYCKENFDEGVRKWGDWQLDMMADSKEDNDNDH